jgi:hypothetical protein
MVRASEFDAAQSELATLREELDTSKRNEHNSEVAYKAAIEKQEELREDFDIVSEERDNAKRNASAFEERMGNLQVENGELQQRLTAAEQRNAELEALLDTPHTSDWFEGVKLEAGHQIKRWGSEHDAGKGPADWFWLIGYLAQKAMGAQMLGNDEKAKHHTISTGAALLNWFRAIAGDSNVMRPGIDAACAKPTESGASE